MEDDQRLNKLGLAEKIKFITTELNALFAEANLLGLTVSPCLIKGSDITEIKVKVYDEL